MSLEQPSVVFHSLFFLKHSILVFKSFFSLSTLTFLFPSVSIDMSVFLSGLCLALPVSAPAGSS